MPLHFYGGYVFKRLREFCSIEQGSEVVVGPCIVEVTNEQYEQNIWKFEPENEDSVKVLQDLEKDQLEAQVELEKIKDQENLIKENLKQKKLKKEKGE